MKKQKLLVVLLVVFLITLLPSCKKSPPPFECTDTIACVDIAPEDPIKIGVIQALSKGPTVIGKEQVNSIKLAVAMMISKRTISASLLAMGKCPLKRLSSALVLILAQNVAVVY